LSKQSRRLQPPPDVITLQLVLPQYECHSRDIARQQAAACFADGPDGQKWSESSRRARFEASGALSGDQFPPAEAAYNDRPIRLFNAMPRTTLATG
jgi:hypothetical protein